MPSCVVNLLRWVGASEILPTSETLSPLWFNCLGSLLPSRSEGSCAAIVGVA